MLPSWHGRYPNNPVLRILTPRDTCRNLAIYPVKLTQVGMSARGPPCVPTCHCLHRLKDQQQHAGMKGL